ncbi:MAG: DUF427 domain-containing protein [Acidimicrobiales bacterium]|nr:DUF427 domain-containing protein [Acidimicrobiales bacterium]
MNDYPGPLVPVDHVEPVPRRVRGTLGGHTVFDTVEARYVFELPYYPQYYVPVGDVDRALLIDEGRTQHLKRGRAQRYGLRAGGIDRPGSAHLYTESDLAGITGTLRFDWDALDHWYEEDEEIHVHPRSPYTRVDALRSTRPVRVELDGVLLAESSSPVLVFETGLPTRYYLDRTEVDESHLVPTITVTRCPYKGTTTDYWTVDTGEGRRYPDLAWSYGFPTRELLPIAGLVAFYNEHVDLTVDGRRLVRPSTHFS